MFGFTVVATTDTNLALNKSYTVSQDSNTSNAYPNLALKDTEGKLTNGKTGAQNNSGSAEYIHFYRGTYTYVTIDLEQLCSVSKVAIGQYQNIDAGIYASREVYIYGSADGNDFALIGTSVDENRLTSNKSNRLVIDVDADSQYSVRYVKVKFSTDIFCFVDEIAVYGSANSNGKSIAAETEYEPKGFAGAVDGVNHICLMYSGAHYQGSASTIGNITKAQLTPYFAYVDGVGKPIDTMFEAMLFLPLQPGQSSEDTSYPYSFSKKAGFEAFLDNTIVNKGYNFDALNELVGEIKTDIGYDADYQYPVYLAVPYIYISNSSFGEIGGETVTPNSLAARQKIVDWYIDLAIQKFNDAGYTNLKLNGFYWYGETVLYKYGSDEIELIKHFNSYCDTKNYTSIWIPYYCSPGYNKALELGFDAAVLQTGYAFPKDASSETGDAKAGVCDDAIVQAAKYGLGLEIEVSSLDADRYDRYYKYLQAAYSAGVMNDGLFMYYQGGGPGVYYGASKTASGSTNRMGYDNTYKFIHATFESSAPVIQDGVHVIVPLGEIAQGGITVTDNDTTASKLKINEIQKPTELTVGVEGSGYLVLNAKKTTEPCVTSVTFSVTDGYNVSNTASVTIHVVAECFTADRIGGNLKNDHSVLYVYDAEDDATTGTGDNAYEVVISSDGYVTSVGGHDSTIPEGGYVLAASGSKQDYLIQNVSVGSKATVDAVTGNIVFGEWIFDGDESQAESSTQTESQSEPAAAGIPWLYIAIAAAVLAVAAIAIIIIVRRFHQ